MIRFGTRGKLGPRLCVCEYRVWRMNTTKLLEGKTYVQIRSALVDPSLFALYMLVDTYGFLGSTY